MKNYERLTKRIVDEHGKSLAVCRYFGTDMCQTIHTSQNCLYCPMLQCLLEQLCVFEDVYTEEDNANESDTNTDSDG